MIFHCMLDKSNAVNNAKNNCRGFLWRQISACCGFVLDENGKTRYGVVFDKRFFGHIHRLFRPIFRSHIFFKKKK